MDVQAEKLGLIQWLTELSDENVIAKIKALREGKIDWWEQISAEERAEIDEGIAQADRGELKSHDEAMAKYQKWL
jgi:predicted transcriptional regulator